MDVVATTKSLQSVCAELSEAVERLTTHGLDTGEEGLRALEYAQAFAEVAGTLECARQNLAEVWASLDADAPGLKSVVAGA